MSDFPVIIAGTYEEFLLGYTIDYEENKDTIKLNLCLASHSHQASVRSVSAWDHFLASSGADEYINIYNMLTKKEVAVLKEHEGTVNAVVFAPDGSHLLSASQDGSIAIFKSKEWRLVKMWKDCHKKGVFGLSIHPSGKLLLSYGGDNIMRAWNLVKGRQAYAVNLSKKVAPGADINGVGWSKKGNYYVIIVGTLIEVYLVESAAIVYVIKSLAKITCYEFLTDTLICVGREDGFLELHDIKTKKILIEHKGHEARIKCLKVFTRKKQHFVITADSKGVLKVLQYKKENGKSVCFEKAQVNADCRITCLCLVSLAVKCEDNDEPPKKIKKKHSTSGVWEIEDIDT